MVEMSVAEYADHAGVSRRRVQAAAAAGVLPARELAGRWLIDADAVRRRGPGRPLSARSTGALVARLSNDAGWRDGLSASEGRRTQQRVDVLRSQPDPGRVMSAWIRSARPEPVGYRVADADLDDLRADDRLVLGGISDARSGLSDAGAVEAHVAERHLVPVIREYLLVPADRPNAYLHVRDAVVPRPLPFGELIADLAQHDSPRERAAVARLLREYR